MRLLFIVLLLIPLRSALAQADERVGVQTVWVMGARSSGLGSAGVALPDSRWASLNPASFAAALSASLHAYADQGFGLAELRTGAVQLVYPFRSATAGLGAQTLGFDDFRVSNATLALARGFTLGTSRRVEAGLALTLHHAQVAGYGSGSGLAFDAGVIVALLPDLRAGFSGRNVTASRLAGVEPLPQTLAIGLAYQPEPRVQIVADVVKDTRFPASVRAGVEVLPASPIALRVGVGTQPSRFSAGAGVQVGPLRADLAASRHDVLGWTPAVELGVTW